MALETEVKETKQVKKENDNQTVTITMAQLEAVIKAAVEGGASKVGVSQMASNPVDQNLMDTLNQRINRRMKQGELFNMKLAKDKDYMRVRIGKIYIPYTGPFITASVNASVVKVPVDGQYHTIHKAFYGPIMGYINYIDEIMERNRGNDRFLGINAGDVAKVN